VIEELIQCTIIHYHNRVFSVKVIQDERAKIQQILWIKKDGTAATIQQIQRIIRGEESQNSTTTTDNHVRCKGNNPTRTVSDNDICRRNIGQVRRSDTQQFSMQHESRTISGDEQILQEAYQNLKLFITTVLTFQSPVLTQEYSAFW